MSGQIRRPRQIGDAPAPSGGGGNRGGSRGGSRGGNRGQANLVALVAALFALTSVTVIAVAVANGALAGETRDADERHAATAVADRLVEGDSPLANRSNVLDAADVRSVTAADLRRWYPALAERSFRVTLDGEELASAGSPAGGTTMRRVVLVERTAESTVTPRFRAGNHVILPRRTSRADVDIDPPENVSVRAVRANERTVLHDPDGLAGAFTVEVSRRETVQFTFAANGTLGSGDVELTLYPRQTRKAELAVTVDD